MSDFGWQSGMTLGSANRHMLDNEIATDVTFLVDEAPNQQQIQAHKYILVSRSPVFFAMLCGDLSEAYTNEPIKIPDATPNAFKALLK